MPKNDSQKPAAVAAVEKVKAASDAVVPNAEPTPHEAALDKMKLMGAGVDPWGEKSLLDAAAKFEAIAEAVGLDPLGMARAFNIYAHAEKAKA